MLQIIQIMNYIWLYVRMCIYYWFIMLIFKFVILSKLYPYINLWKESIYKLSKDLDDDENKSNKTLAINKWKNIKRKYNP